MAIYDDMSIADLEGRRPEVGTAVLFAGDFATVLLSTRWHEGDESTKPHAVVLLRPGGRSTYATLLATQDRETGQVSYVAGHYDLSAVDAALDFAARARRAGTPETV